MTVSVPGRRDVFDSGRSRNKAVKGSGEYARNSLPVKQIVLSVCKSF